MGNLGVHSNTPGTTEFNVHSMRWDIQSTKIQRVWHDLQPGDVVQMIPRANYAGWACLVREARIRIEYEPSQKVVETNEDTAPSSGGKTPWPMYPSRLDSEDHQVRILVVEPASSADEPIVCSLVTTPLSSAPPFDALSYCWGAETSREVLRIDGLLGGDLSVSRSVVAALRRLRPKEQASKLAIWIDQICINQRDFDERKEQVRLMAEIYSGAARVHVWLGEGDVATWTALRIVRNTFNARHGVCPGGAACKCGCRGTYTAHALELEDFRATVREHQMPTWHLLNWAFVALVRNEHGELAEAAGGVNNLQLTTLMSTLFVNPWFRRVWVLQEALLARDAVVHCGEEVVP